MGILALIVVNSAQLVMPKMTGQLTDMIAEGTFTRAELGRFCLFLVGLAVVIAVFRYLWRINIMGAARKMEYTPVSYTHLQGEARANLWSQQGAGPLEGDHPREHPHHDCRFEGECGPIPGGDHCR